MPRKQRKRAPDEVLYNTTFDYPLDGQGHSYHLRDVPADVWDRARARAADQRRPIRWLLIKLLDAYGRQKLSV